MTRSALVKMYNVGFGDCFLVTLPTDGGERTVLFDCGSIKSGGPTMPEVVTRLLTDVGTRIDVVVCTHRHRDHIAGFADDRWKGVEVGEVWMPWTEDPDDPEATRIRDAQTSLALALETNVAARLAAPGLSADRRGELELALDLAVNAKLNDAAMETLHTGFSSGPDAPRRFLAAFDRDGKPTDRYETPLLPGVTVHVLGPTRDESIIRDMDPPKGKGYVHLLPVAAGPGGALAPAGIPEPFSDEWWAEGQTSALSPEEMERIASFSDGFAGEVAAALESAVNGTSLMLVLEVAGKLLLFPGDAQWGTWDAAMARPKARKLLSRVGFYKVGHHGSHNATPSDFVESILPLDVPSMISVCPYGKWKVPLPKLVTELSARGPVVRSDRPGEAASPFRVVDGVVELPIRI